MTEATDFLRLATLANIFHTTLRKMVLLSIKNLDRKLHCLCLKVTLLTPFLCFATCEIISLPPHCSSPVNPWLLFPIKGRVLTKVVFNHFLIFPNAISSHPIPHVFQALVVSPPVGWKSAPKYSPQFQVSSTAVFVKTFLIGYNSPNTKI